IYHDCDDGIKPGSRKIKFKIPNSYVTEGQNPKKVFDLGTLNLETVFASEERELIVNKKRRNILFNWDDFNNYIF
uniref:DNA primase n=1 Tax=Meloidogyne hapla TaxID=6305 RepID=A0A1I8BM51_MELHA